MLYFPNAKINLGLRVLRKRPDGYHDIESIFLPVGWCDVLEIANSDGVANKITWKNFGLDIPGDLNDNLISKAYHILEKDFKLSSININLLKQIPMGAGLGGGSADGAFALKALNKIFDLNLNEEQLMKYASHLGSDCSFFIPNKPSYVNGIGDKPQIIDFKWPCKYIFIVCPPYHIATVEAYKNVIPDAEYDSSLLELINAPVQTWKNTIHNDFEAYAFKQLPEIGIVKDKLYSSGALYASMTGSGSAVYGFFDVKSDIELPENYNYKWLETTDIKA